MSKIMIGSAKIHVLKQKMLPNDVSTRYIFSILNLFFYNFPYQEKS